jgi:hypothetical protein
MFTTLLIYINKQINIFLYIRMPNNNETTFLFKTFFYVRYNEGRLYLNTIFYATPLYLLFYKI